MKSLSAAHFSSSVHGLKAKHCEGREDKPDDVGTEGPVGIMRMQKGRPVLPPLLDDHPSLKPLLLSLRLLCINHSDGRHVDDISHCVTSLEDMDWFFHAHQDWPNLLSTTKFMKQLVGDVAGL